MTTEQNYPPALKQVWLWSNLLGAIFFLAIWGLCWVFLRTWLLNFTFGPFLIWGLLLAIIIWASLDIILIPFRYQVHHYQVTEQAIKLKSGFFWRSTTIIPLVRVQNISLDQGPLLRFFDLTSLVISTASDRHTLEGLTTTTAQQLQTYLLNLVNEVVEDD